jgi:myo-inositol 2-dehydrogenase/D-chiro-inositol 1-dehydrogenase
MYAAGVLNVALVGVGFMGSFHAQTLARRLPGAHLAGIADPIPGKAQAAADALGCARATTDYHELLADPGIHAVVVATPATDHAIVIEAAARAGKAIFCEKPITDTLEAADRAIATVQSTGVLLQIGFQRRFDGGFVRAHDLAASGALGAIQLLRSITRDPRPYPDEQTVARDTWSIFSDTLVHDFDVLRWLAGSEPRSIFAMSAALNEPFRTTQARDTAVVTVTFENGALGTADSSFWAPYGYDVRAEVFGLNGMVEVGDGRANSAVLHNAEGSLMQRAHWFLDMFRDAYIAELADFVDCAQTGRAPRCAGADGRAAVLMALAATRSAETGRAVDVAQVEPAA